MSELDGLSVKNVGWPESLAMPSLLKAHQQEINAQTAERLRLINQVRAFNLTKKPDAPKQCNTVSLSTLGELQTEIERIISIVGAEHPFELYEDQIEIKSDDTVFRITEA